MSSSPEKMGGSLGDVKAATPNNLAAVSDRPQQPRPPTSSTAAPHPVIPARNELVFHCQLAHGSQTRELKDFSSARELYARVAKAFEMSPEDVIFCTLNTHRVDVSHLLGSQIGLEDFIFAHVKGQGKEVSVTKNEMSLGLTITDNGAGSCFVKRIKEGSTIANVPKVCVGDMIASLNDKSTVGVRHYELAKMLKDIPLLSTFTMKLIEPKKAFDAIAPQKSRRSKTVPQLLEEKASQLEAAVGKEEGRATLKFKGDGSAVVEQVITSWETVAADKIDRLLESYLGIRDLELAQQIVELGRSASSVDEYAINVDTHFGEFEFPNEFIFNAWTHVDSSKPGDKS